MGIIDYLRRMLRVTMLHNDVTEQVEVVLSILGEPRTLIPDGLDVEYDTPADVRYFELDNLKIVKAGRLNGYTSKTHVFYLHNGIWIEVYRRHTGEETPYIFKFGAWVKVIERLVKDAHDKQRKRQETENEYRYGELE